MPLRLAYALAERVLKLDPEAPNFETELTIAKREATDVLEVRKRGRGNPDLDIARARGAASRKKIAAEFRAQMKPVIARLRAEGHNSYRQLARALDALGIAPQNSDKWAPGSVRKLELADADEVPERPD